MRSLLEPADLDPATLSSALAAGVDVLLVARDGAARIGDRIAGGPRLLVRIDAIDHDAVEAAVAAGAEGVLLAGASGVAAVEHLAALLAVAEARAGRADGVVRIVASVGSGAGLLALPKLGRAHHRVTALAWDAGALAADLGAESAREADGSWIEPLSHARTRLLAAAAAAGLPAIDTGSDLGLDGFRTEAEAARRHGFGAKIARSVAQVALLKAMPGPTAAWPSAAGAAKVGRRRAKGRERDGQSDL